MAALPGTKNAGLVSILPLAPKSVSYVPFVRPDRPPAKPEDRPNTNYRMVTPDYFRAMGIPLLAGRYFTEEDNGDRPAVVIISSVLAKNHFSFATVSLLLAMISLGACWIASRRTLNVDPVVTLRSE